MIRVAVMAALLCALPASAAQENSMTGLGLLDVCTRADYHWIEFCHGYMQAVVDATDGELSCAPSGATRASITGEVVGVMASIPALGDLNAFAVVNAVMQRLYPCNID